MFVVSILRQPKCSGPYLVAGAIRGCEGSDVLLGAAKVPHHGPQGQSEHLGMPLLSSGGKLHRSAKLAWPAGVFPFADDLPDFQRLCAEPVKKLEQDIRNQGEIRWKHAMHLLRLLVTGAASLRECRVPVRIEAHRDRLLAVKRGEVPWSELDAWRKELHRDFEQALGETKLPERPDYERVNAFLVEVRRSQVR
jgi:hypothetical protein